MKTKKEGTIVSINISDKKGVSKTRVETEVEIKKGLGIVGDSHVGTLEREISLLPEESLGGVPYGGYGENIDTKGIDLFSLNKGTILKLGKDVEIKITRHGKICIERCSIYHKLGHCIMQERGSLQ